MAMSDWAGDTESARMQRESAQRYMHALHDNLLLELQKPSSDVALEQAARLVLQGARDVRAWSRSSALLVSVPYSSGALDKQEEKANAPYTLNPSPATLPAIPAAGVDAGDKYLKSLSQILLVGRPWGLQGEVSEAALSMMLEALSEVMGITVTPWQLASTRDMLPALLQAVEQGQNALQTSGLFLLSQITLTGTSTAVKIAELPGLPDACYEAIIQKHSSEKITQNSALLINNLAALGGEDAVRVLSAHGNLVRELAAWLDSAHDAATLQRLTGVFNHLSRSAVPFHREHTLLIQRDRILFDAAPLSASQREHIL